jgi:hypothetical protein
MDHQTVAVIVRVYGPSGVGVADAPVQAQLSEDVRFQGFTIPAQVVSDTDAYGICVMRLWPNVLGDVPTEYKFTITNPESGKRKIVYAVIPAHDVFLDEISSANSGDWVDGGIGNPSGGGNNTATAGTVTAGTTTTGLPGTAAQVINRGTAQNRIFDFVVPAGRDGTNGLNGLNGTGTITIGQTITGAPGTPASVVNVGTADRAVLDITIPQGIPGNSTGTGGTGGALPAGGTDKQVLVKVGTADGAATWQTLAPIVDTLMGTYLWESTVVTPPTNPGSNVLDATTLAAYLNAIAEASLGSKRVAGANAIIVAMGTAQKLTLKRNGIAVLTADYTGAMTQTNNGTNIGVTLPSTFTVGPIAAADVATGTWTGEITGGTGFARKITLPIATDVSTAPGQGFNPTVNLIIPRSVDGLA